MDCGNYVHIFDPVQLVASDITIFAQIEKCKYWDYNNFCCNYIKLIIHIHLIYRKPINMTHFVKTTNSTKKSVLEVQNFRLIWVHFWCWMLFEYLQQLMSLRFACNPSFLWSLSLFWKLDSVSDFNYHKCQPLAITWYLIFGGEGRGILANIIIIVW